MSEKLTYREALQIYDMMTHALPEADEEFMEYYYVMVLKPAIRYANIRAGWILKNRAERLDADSERTAAHNSWIAGLQSLARNEGEAGLKWLQILGEDDRKRIGDYACFVALFSGLDAR